MSMPIRHGRRRQRPCPTPRRRQRGVVLIVGLVFLVAVTLISLTMVRSYALEEKMAGNTREKQRAFEAAQDALAYGEAWLPTGATPYPAPCTTPSADIALLSVCSNRLLAPQALPWAAWTSYTPPSMQVAAGGGLAASGSGADINYQAAPGLYISYLGKTPDLRGDLYEVTGFSGAGSYETMSVVRSTYELTAPGRNIDQ